MKQKLEQSLERVARWVENHDYRGYEPADGNASPLHALTFGSAFLQRLLQQSVLRAPFNLRPLLGVKPHDSAIGRGYMAAGYLMLYRRTGNSRCREQAVACLEWLMQNKSPGYRHHAWGNDYAYATRSGRLPKLEPIIVWSAIIGLAFLDAYELLGDAPFLKTADSVCDWILELPREQTPTGACLSYHAFQQTSIHNSNMLGAALLARTAVLSKTTRGLDVAQQAMLYSCKRQRADGAWLYGENPKYHWVDNFHTGYNLDALLLYQESTGDMAFSENIRRGLDYFLNHFFEEDGRAKYYDRQTYPIDIQCAAQAIETLARFSEADRRALPLALKVANWTLDNLQSPDGHFFYRDLGWIKVKIPLMHWGQATMFKALACLLDRDLDARKPTVAPQSGRPVACLAQVDSK